MTYEPLVYESANKRSVSLAMELMGAQVLQRLAAENGARGHLAPATKEYFRAVEQKGLADAPRERDAKFGDGRARAFGPGPCFERGFGIEPEK
jgi:enoyl-CoA hydratase